MLDLLVEPSSSALLPDHLPAAMAGTLDLLVRAVAVLGLVGLPVNLVGEVLSSRTQVNATRVTGYLASLSLLTFTAIAGLGTVEIAAQIGTWFLPS